MIEERDKYNNTALHLASVKGHQATVKVKLRFVLVPAIVVFWHSLKALCVMVGIIVRKEWFDATLNTSADFGIVVKERTV